MPPPLEYERTANFEESRTGGVTAIAFSPTGNYLASAGLDRRVCVWEVDNGKLIHSFVTSSTALSVAWVPDRDGMLLCGCQDGSINVLTAPSQASCLCLIEVDLTEFFYQSVLRGATFPRTHSFPVEHLAVKGKRLASGAHAEVAIWGLSSDGEWSHLLDLGSPPKNSYNNDREVLVTSVHWTTSKWRDPLLLVTYLHHGYMIYNVKDWSQILTVPLNSLVANASVTDNGRLLAVSNMVSGFDVYQTSTGTSLGTLSHSIGRLHVVPVLFAHGGNAIIGGSCVGEVVVWDATTLRKHQTLLLGDDDKILSLAAHYDTLRDCFLLATGSVNEDATMATITLWCGEDRGGAKRSFAWRTWLFVCEWFPTLLSGFIGLLGAFLTFLFAAITARAVWFST